MHWHHGRRQHFWGSEGRLHCHSLWNNGGVLRHIHCVHFALCTVGGILQSQSAPVQLLVPLGYQRCASHGHHWHFLRHVVCGPVVSNWCFADHSGHLTRPPSWGLVHYLLLGRRRTDARSSPVVAPRPDGPIHRADQCHRAHRIHAVSHFVRNHELRVLCTVSHGCAQLPSHVSVLFMAHSAFRIRWLHVRYVLRQPDVCWRYCSFGRCALGLDSCAPHPGRMG
mmetsp:Transcript_11796/g.30305  ORF Transcript_11796/g.30305 Transcript_11796/m.30305 type:complete len:224 (-) Transcript_11796:309-980(-)